MTLVSEKKKGGGGYLRKVVNYGYAELQSQYLFNEMAPGLKYK